VGSSDGGQSGKSNGKSWAAASLLCQNNLIKEADRRVRWRVSLTLMDKLVKS